MRARATVGEVSGVLANVFDRYEAKSNLVTGVYKDQFGDDEIFSAIDTALEKFKSITNEAPRLYMAKLGQDGHDRGAKSSPLPFMIWALKWSWGAI